MLQNDSKSIPVQQQQESVKQKNSSKKLKILLISVSVLLVIIGVLAALFFSGVILEKESCPGRNQDANNNCACKSGYYSQNGQNSNCVGPFDENVFSKDDIDISLKGQENNVAVKVQKRNLYQKYQYAVTTEQTDVLQEGLTNTQTNTIYHDIHVITEEVNENTFKVYAFLNKSLYVENDEQTTVDGYPNIAVKEQNQENSSENQEIPKELLTLWQQLEAESNDISYTQYFLSALPIAQVTLTKDGTIKTIQMPINIRQDFEEIIVNFFEHYSPMLDSANFSKGETIDENGNRRILFESGDNDEQQQQSAEIVADNVKVHSNSNKKNVSDGTSINYQTKSASESDIENGYVKKSQQEAEMNVTNSMESTDNYYQNITVKQIVECQHLGYELIEEKFLTELEDIFEENYLIELTLQSFNERRENKQNFENINELLVDEEGYSNGRRDLLSPGDKFFEDLNFDLFRREILGINVQAGNQFACEEDEEVYSCYLQPFIYIGPLSITVNQVEMDFNKENGGLQKTFEILSKTLLDKTFGKSQYYLTPIGIPLYISISLNFSTSITAEVTFSTELTITFEANLNANATLSAEGGVTVFIAKAGAYIDAELFDGNVDFVVELDVSSQFSGYAQLDMSYSAFNIQAGVFAQYATFTWQQKCTSFGFFNICIYIPYPSWADRIDILPPLIINGPSGSIQLFHVPFGNDGAGSGSGTGGIGNGDQGGGGGGIGGGQHNQWVQHQDYSASYLDGRLDFKWLEIRSNDDQESLQHVLSNIQVDQTGQIWAISHESRVYLRKLENSVSKWIIFQKLMGHISIQNHILCGIDTDGNIQYKDTQPVENWIAIYEYFKNVAIDINNDIWAKGHDLIIKYREPDTFQWQNTSGSLEQFDVSNGILFGLTADGHAQYTIGKSDIWVHEEEEMQFQYVSINEKGQRFGVTKQYELIMSKFIGLPWENITNQVEIKDENNLEGPPITKNVDFNRVYTKGNYVTVLTEDGYPFVGVSGVFLQDVTYLGCFLKENQFHSTIKAEGYDYTVQQCLDKCIQYQFPYAALHQGSDCYCLLEYDNSVPSQDCSLQCLNEANSKCGGQDSFSVYSTKWVNIGCQDFAPSSYIIAPTEILFTPQNCQLYCQSKAFNYAGLKNGKECYCFHDQLEYGLDFQTDSQNCDLQCELDASQNCGGTNNFMQVYGVPLQTKSVCKEVVIESSGINDLDFVKFYIDNQLDIEIKQKVYTQGWYFLVYKSFTLERVELRVFDFLAQDTVQDMVDFIDQIESNDYVFFGYQGNVPTSMPQEFYQALQVLGWEQGLQIIPGQALAAFSQKDNQGLQIISEEYSGDTAKIRAQMCQKYDFSTFKIKAGLDQNGQIGLLNITADFNDLQYVPQNGLNFLVFDKAYSTLKYSQVFDQQNDYLEYMELNSFIQNISQEDIVIYGSYGDGVGYFNYEEFDGLGEIGFKAPYNFGDNDSYFFGIGIKGMNPGDGVFEIVDLSNNITDKGIITGKLQ